MALGALVLLLAITLAGSEQVAAEQASAPASPAAGQIEAGRLDAGENHTCTVLAGDSVRCWGFGADGRLGYGNYETIGDFETPGSVGPVQLGQGATAISAGGYHSCAVLVDAGIRCWGYAVAGVLGYGNRNNIGDNETPGSAGPVDVGSGRTAQAVTTGQSHTCAVLDLGGVRCWGISRNGRLGSADPALPTIGDTETPASVGPVDLGSERSASAISAGNEHTCALLDDQTVRCWGNNADGRLGYPDRADAAVGDDETPGSAGPVSLGRGASAITAGGMHTCALLDDASVRCWGSGARGQLGYANTHNVGDNETPATAGPVDLGGRGAKAISAGDFHTCALLDDGSVRCWGSGSDGRLGYGRLEFGIGPSVVGDNEVPGSVGPVDLGPGRTALAITTGERHTCAHLDDDSLRCWGYGAVGSLGYCDQNDVGDNETPGSMGPVVLLPPSGGGSGCPGESPVAAPGEAFATAPDAASATAPGAAPATSPGAASAAAPGARTPSLPLQPATSGLAAQAARSRGLHTCRASAARHDGGESRRARGLSGSRRTRAAQQARRHRAQSIRRCLTRYGRTPGPVTNLGLSASARAVLLTFEAAGTDGNRGPVAQTYLVKQSRRPIDGPRDFRAAQSLCDGRCRFDDIPAVGSSLELSVTQLRTQTTYHYAIRARDNVSGRLGPQSKTVKATTLAASPAANSGAVRSG